MRDLLGGAVDAEQVRAIVQQELANVPSRKLDVTYQGQTREVNGHKHPKFEEILQCVAAGLNVVLIGPAGCGKTYLSSQVAAALGLRYSANSCSAGMSEAQLCGWLLPTGEQGRFEWFDAPLTIAYREGNALHCLDELDAADANTATFINTMAANGHFHIAQRIAGQCVERHPTFRLMAIMNTFGLGADMIYAGRNQQDGATLDRFWPIEMDYDREYERTLACEQVLTAVNAMREAVQKFKLRRVVGTRKIQQAQIALDVTKSWSKTRQSLLAGWTADEISKAGV